jgi:hypothetical protein
MGLIHISADSSIGAVVFVAHLPHGDRGVVRGMELPSSLARCPRYILRVEKAVSLRLASKDHSHGS